MENIPSFEDMPQYIADLSATVNQLKEDLSSISSQLGKKTEDKESEPFIGIDDACELLHLAKPTIYKMAQKGLIPHYKPTKELLFRRSELVKWVEDSHRFGKISIEEMAKAMSAGNRRKAKRWD